MSVATQQHGVHQGSGAPPHGRMDAPSRLWAMLLAAVIAVLVTAAVAAAGLSGRESTAEHTDQATEALYSEVQDLSYSLADANATAATALLIGPVTPSSFTIRFGSDITHVEDLLAAASQRVAGDAYASNELRLLAEQMPVYTQSIGQALANNRFGYPVAGAYLRQASNLLTGHMLPEVTAVINEQQDATQAGMSSAASLDWLVVVLCLLALGVLAVVGTGIARRTRRRMNPGVLGAKIALLALLGWTFVAAFSAGSAVDHARADFGNVMQAQIGGSQLALAETHVALQQIDRGEDGGVDQRNAQAALTSLRQIGDSSVGSGSQNLSTDVGALVTCAQSAISQADSGDYLHAIATTVGSGQDVGRGGCEPKAMQVRADLVGLTKQSQQSYDADMSELQGAYAGGGVLVLPILAGLLGAAAVAWGVNRRLAEYR